MVINGLTHTRGPASETPLEILVAAFVAGLFAKTVIEILLKTVKEVFHVET
jgi:hypothetical protein